MCWKPSRDKGFKVNDYFRILVGSIDYCFPWKNIRKQKTFSNSFLCLDCCFREKFDD